MANARNLSTLAQGASTAGILGGTYGGTGASLSPTTAGNTIFTTDGTTWSSTQKIVRGTAVASTSGTSIDFTSIPSWVKRITLIFQGVSTNGTSIKLVQIGSGSVQNTGYVSSGMYVGNGNLAGTTSSTAGFPIYSNAAAEIISGHMIFTLLSGNLWVSSSTFKWSTTYGGFGGGDVTLSGALDRVRLTTVNGTDTFDAGSVNILYE